MEKNCLFFFYCQGHGRGDFCCYHKHNENEKAALEKDTLEKRKLFITRDRQDVRDKHKALLAWCLDRALQEALTCTTLEVLHSQSGGVRRRGNHQGAGESINCNNVADADSIPFIAGAVSKTAGAVSKTDPGPRRARCLYHLCPVNRCHHVTEPAACRGNRLYNGG